MTLISHINFCVTLISQFFVLYGKRSDFTKLAMVGVGHWMNNYSNADYIQFTVEF